MTRTQALARMLHDWLEKDADYFRQHPQYESGSLPDGTPVSIFFEGEVDLMDLAKAIEAEIAKSGGGT